MMQGLFVASALPNTRLHPHASVTDHNTTITIIYSAFFIPYLTPPLLPQMATRQRNTRPHIVEAHASPVVQVIPVDVRSSIVSLDRDNHVKIWGFVPPQALPMTLKTRALPGILAPMMQFQ